jgi:hypothetical protein
MHIVATGRSNDELLAQKSWQNLEGSIFASEVIKRSNGKAHVQ